MSWLAILKRRFWPPLIPLRIGVPTRVLACFCSPNDDNNSSTRRRRSSVDIKLRKGWASFQMLDWLSLLLGKGQASSKIKGLPDSQGSDESILLLNIGADALKYTDWYRSTIDSDRSRKVSAKRRVSMSQCIQQGCFATSGWAHDSRQFTCGWQFSITVLWQSWN